MRVTSLRVVFMRVTSHQGGLSEDGHFKVVFMRVISLHGGLYEGHPSSGCFCEGVSSSEWSL